MNGRSVDKKVNKWVYLTDWRFKKACGYRHSHFSYKKLFYKVLVLGWPIFFTKLSSPLDQDLILYPAHPPQCVNEIISICINVCFHPVGRVFPSGRLWDPPITTLSPSIKALSLPQKFPENNRKTIAYCSQTIAYY